jgi:hypothetical protein
VAAEGAKKPKILLPGRDTFLWEVIARVEGFDGTIFRPELSSSVSSIYHTNKKLLDHGEVQSWGQTCFGVDSGYKGSVLNYLWVSPFRLMAYGSSTPSPTPEAKAATQRFQLLPKLHHQTAVNMCVDMEVCPKYWTRADTPYNNGTYTLNQSTSDLDEFKAAAVLTIHIVRNLDPSLTIDPPETEDRKMMGGSIYPAVGVNVANGKGWFFCDGRSLASYQCNGISGVKYPGCHRKLKIGRWVYSAVWDELKFSNHGGKSNGQILCHRCVKELGLTPPEGTPPL